ncbi:MAG: 3-oxoacyl-ACP reductase family protein [Candidatus Bathyarchaeia archaeon]
MRLQGKVALITGAGRGIGRAIALLFAQEGAKVAINYSKSEKEALSLVEEIRRLGGVAMTVKADVSKPDEVKNMVQKVLQEYGKIDILVNNAGIVISKPFLETTEEIWDRTIDINLKGTYLCSKEVAPLMLGQGKGKIINIASVSGLAQRSALGNVPYAASKAGVIGLTRSLAVNLGPYVNVNAICPGVIETDMTASLPAEYTRMRVEETPLKRTGKPEEVAMAALFLASEDSDFITGEVITVAGGRGMR